MRIEARLLIVIGVFFAIIGVIYWYTSYEDSGTVMLAAAAILGLLPGGYYLWWSNRMRPRPSDDPEASIGEGSGTIGTFPGSSIWPFVMGMGAFFVGLSFVFGIWFVPVAAGLLISAAIGATVESRRDGMV